MRLGNVNDEELHLIPIVLVQLVEGGHLPPERWSGITAKNENHRLALRGEGRKLELRALVQLGKRKLGRGRSNLYAARARMQPEVLKRQHQECHLLWNSRHHLTKPFGRTTHDAVKRNAADGPQYREHATCRYDRL